MFRKHLAAALSALLVVGVCAPCARAQSGRHFPRAEAEKAFIVLTGEKPEAVSEVAEKAPAGEVRARRVVDKDFDLRGLNAGRPAHIVYAQNGNGRTSTKARIEVGVLFTCLILGIILTGK